MNKSETIVNLAIALTKAQAEWPAIGRDATGFNNKYAPLDKVLAAVRPVLAKHELSFVQTPGTSDHIDQIVLTSMLVHSSGEFLEETMTMPVPQVGKSNAAQCYGAGLTYARRYSLEAFLGIASTEDTDGASGSKPTNKPAQKSNPQHHFWMTNKSSTKVKRATSGLTSLLLLTGIPRFNMLTMPLRNLDSQQYQGKRLIGWKCTAL